MWSIVETSRICEGGQIHHKTKVVAMISDEIKAREAFVIRAGNRRALKTEEQCYKPTILEWAYCLYNDEEPHRNMTPDDLAVIGFLDESKSEKVWGVLQNSSNVGRVQDLWSCGVDLFIHSLVDKEGVVEVLSNYITKTCNDQNQDDLIPEGCSEWEIRRIFLSEC